jgi:hypothetical protein
LAQNITYTGNPIGNWATIGSQYTWNESLGPESWGDTLGWVADEIQPLVARYLRPDPGEYWSGPVVNNSAEQMDTIALTYVNGNNSGTPYVTGNDGDGLTETAKYIMALHLLTEPPYTIGCPIPSPYDAGRPHYKPVPIPGAMSTDYFFERGLTIYTGELSDYDGYDYDGLNFSKIVIAGTGVATAAELPYISALCGLATIVLDQATEAPRIDPSAFTNVPWSAAWSDPLSTFTFDGKSVSGPVRLWSEPPPTQYAYYQVTPLAFSEYNDNWMALDTWGADGYDGPDVHNFVKFAGYLIAGAFDISGDAHF